MNSIMVHRLRNTSIASSLALALATSLLPAPAAHAQVTIAAVVASFTPSTGVLSVFGDALAPTSSSGGLIAMSLREVLAPTLAATARS